MDVQEHWKSTDMPTYMEHNSMTYVIGILEMRRPKWRVDNLVAIQLGLEEPVQGMSSYPSIIHKAHL